MHSTAPYDARKKMYDPCLTSRGLKQARNLNNTFTYSSKVTHILSSPMLRTLETTWLGFKDAILDRKIKVIAIPDLREWGNGPCNTGSTMHAIFEKIPELKNRLETSLVPDIWVMNSESGPKEAHRPQRVMRIRDELWELGKAAIEGKGGKWSGVELQSVKKGEDVHIVVVSHGGILKALTAAGSNGMLYNSEYKTYVLNRELSAESVQKVTLVETEESKNRQYSEAPY
ncbi:phosphoglycerate mutase [Diplocarpon rosae]|nr:phosphoglycerate mutase [Diplocarpon rosae]